MSQMVARAAQCVRNAADDGRAGVAVEGVLPTSGRDFRVRDMSDRECSDSGVREKAEVPHGHSRSGTVLASRAPRLLRDALPWTHVPGGELAAICRYRADGEGHTAVLSATGSGYHAQLEVSCAFLLAVFDESDAYHRRACAWAAEELHRTRTPVPAPPAATS